MIASFSWEIVGGDTHMTSTLRGGGGGFLFKIGRPRSRGWKNSGHRWTGEWRVSKIGQFYGRHMCIVSNYHLIKHLFINLKKKSFQCFQNILSIHVFAFFMKSII